MRVRTIEHAVNGQELANTTGATEPITSTIPAGEIRRVILQLLLGNNGTTITLLDDKATPFTKSATGQPTSPSVAPSPCPLLLRHEVAQVPS